MTDEHDDSHAEQELLAQIEIMQDPTAPSPPIIRSVTFTIPVLEGSLEAELFQLHDLLLRFHKKDMEAVLIVPEVISGQAPYEEVMGSGLSLVVEVPDTRPDTLNRVTHGCRDFMLRLAAYKHPGFIPRGCWNIFSDIAGMFSDLEVMEHVEASARLLRKDKARGKCPMSRVLYYRLGFSGHFEQAEVDLTEDSVCITFREAPTPVPRPRPKPFVGTIRNR